MWQESKRRLFVTRPVDDKPDDEKSMKRVLGPVDLTMLGVGAIIGTGIFVLAGVAIRDYAGPAIILSFLLTGIACAIVAMCYAELASMIPKAGSAYSYTYSTMGEMVAWIIGWTLIMEYTFGAMAVSIGWSGYIVGLLESFGLNLPAAITLCPFEGGVVNLPAMLIVSLITAILVVGVKESARFNAVIVFIKILVLLLFIIIGIFLIKTDNFDPFMPYGWSGVFSGAGLVFFAYVGFDALSTVAEETKNPQRNMPIGIIASLLICTVIYIAVAIVLIGLVSYDKIDINEPLAAALRERGMGWVSAIIALGALAGITSVLLVNMLAQPRVVFALARDGLLPKKFAEIHPRFKTPWIPTIFFGALVAAGAGFMPINKAAELTNIGTLFAFVLVCFGVIILRMKAKDKPRSFKVPFSPALPIIGAALCVFLIIFLPWTTKMIFIGWVGVGLIIYSFYGYKNSMLANRFGIKGGKPPEEGGGASP